MGSPLKTDPADGPAPASRDATDRRREPRREADRRVLVGITVAVGLFAVVVALGTWWSDDTPDWRKPAIVLGVAGAFLGGWWSLLARRRGR